MSIDRKERQMFRALDNSIHEIENAMEYLEDSISMSFSEKGNELLVEMIKLGQTVNNFKVKMLKYSMGESV